MQVKDSYFIKRDGKYIWLAIDVEPLPTDEIVEVRPMLVADEGKELWKDEECVGQCVWLKDGDTMDNYEERDIPEPEEEVNA